MLNLNRNLLAAGKFKVAASAPSNLKPVAELRKEWIEILAGVPSESSVMYCGSGVSACHNLLALSLAGLDGARLYAGSWSEWCGDSGRPIQSDY